MAKQSILIVHASVGSGHKSAANAICQALEILQAEASISSKFDLKVVDVLDYGRVEIDGNGWASSFTGATRPIYDLTWRYTLTGRLLWGGGSCWSRVMFPAFTQLVRETKPAAIVCTHITAANAAVGAKLITRQNFPIVCVPTDYEVEGLWPHAYTDLFCVANEEMAETLRCRKIPETKIRITGMPVNPEFIKNYDKDKALDEFDLPKNKRIVLAISGASLLQPYVHIKKVIKNATYFMHEFENLHFCIVVGKDSQFKAELLQFIKDHDIKNISVFGYVEQMAMLMSASDLVICKAGGMTVTECLDAEASMILTCRAYGQEKANVKMLTGAGAAIHVTTVRELYGALRLANKNPHAFSGLRQAANYLRKPNAAIDVAKETLLCVANGRGEEEEEGLAPSYESKRRSLASGKDSRSPRNGARKHFISFYVGDKPAHTR
jgi:processive 1,2-diacylglycerol beta-glucosyltransferase